MTLNVLKKAESKNEKAILRSHPKPATHHHFLRKAIVLSICVLIIVTFSAINENLGSCKTDVQASYVKGFGAGIYWDQTCTNTTLSLEWGSIDAGSNSTLTLYVRNEGNSPSLLYLETSNWTPSIATRYLSLAWNYSGQVLKVGEAIPIELTLTVDPTIAGITTFSFTLMITTKTAN